MVNLLLAINIFQGYNSDHMMNDPERVLPGKLRVKSADRDGLISSKITDILFTVSRLFPDEVRSTVIERTQENIRQLTADHPEWSAPAITYQAFGMTLGGSETTPPPSVTSLFHEGTTMECTFERGNMEVPRIVGRPTTIIVDGLTVKYRRADGSVVRKDFNSLPDDFMARSPGRVKELLGRIQKPTTKTYTVQGSLPSPSA